MRGLVAELARGAAADRFMLLGIFLIWIAFMMLLASKGINGVNVSSYIVNLNLYLIALSLFLIVAGGVLLARHRPERPIGFLATSFIGSGFAHRLARGAPMLLALTVFLPLFSFMKSAIPLFNSYTWDNAWIDLDRALHGADAWRVLQPIFGWPLVTSILSIFYHLWLLLIYAGGLWFCFFLDDRQLRTRFFIAYFVSWALLGTVMATALASVGPCFVGPMLGDHRFDEQIVYLREANERFPVLTLAVQDQLIAWSQSGDDGLGRGISAMPSMHVSLAFLFFLAVRQISKLTGLLFGIFFVIILIGSVHLAYHYAVDGYVSIAATWLIWLAAGVAARRISGADMASEPAADSMSASATLSVRADAAEGKS